MTPHKEHGIVPWTIARVKLPCSLIHTPGPVARLLPRRTPRYPALSLVIGTAVLHDDSAASSKHDTTVHRIGQ